MQRGISLVDLAKEVVRQQESKRDFVGNTREMRMAQTSSAQENLTGGFHLDLGKPGRFAMRDLAHEQIGIRLGIPKDYYQRMRTDAPQLLERNVNHWFTEQPENRMIRVLDGQVRAFVSNGYRPLDNADLCDAVLPRIRDLGVEVESCQITERRLYIQAVMPRLTGEIKKGDEVQAGLVVSNSEVGCGSLRIEPLIYRLVCLNGAVMGDHGMKRYHVGKRAGNGDSEHAREFFKDDTRRADDKAFFLKVRDMVDAVLSPKGFHKILDDIRTKAGMKIEGKLDKVVEVTAKKLYLTEGERDSALKNLIEGGDLSAWGLANAVTRIAHTTEDYDRSVELERMGGRIIELPKRDWQVISCAS